MHHGMFFPVVSNSICIIINSKKIFFVLIIIIAKTPFLLGHISRILVKYFKI